MRDCCIKRSHCWPYPQCGIPVLLYRSGCGSIVAMSGFPGYVGLQSRGLIALPTELRRRMHLDEPGAQVEILERDDGVVELRAALPVPADQAWFLSLIHISEPTRQAEIS